MNLILPPHLAAERERAKEEVILQHRTADTQAVFAGWDPTGPSLDPAWQAELDRIAPRDGFHSWLKIAWNPGCPWAPVRRWVIYQMSERPNFPMADVVLPALEGPDPWTLGHWDAQKRNESGGRGKWISHDPITRMQWVLFRETGCYASTFWIIQGGHGGHKAKFTQMESLLSVQNGGPKDPPAPGALSYAPFDRRVVAKLEKLAEASMWETCLRYAAARPGDLDPVERDEAERMRTLLWDWIGSQVAPEAERVAGALAKQWDTADLPRTGRSLVQDIEAEREAFITEDSE